MSTPTNSYTCGILTLSDKGSRGEREDTSGMLLKKKLAEAGFTVSAYLILPDQQNIIEKQLVEWIDQNQVDLIITTGGTGVSPSDRTPEATRAVIDYEIPGLSEAMRLASLKKTIQAVWSRGVAGVRKNSLIINLPGSKKAAEENLDAVLPALMHGIDKIQGGQQDCGADKSLHRPMSSS